MNIDAGSVNVSVPFYFVQDNDGSAPGEPATGLLFSNIETGGSASYQRQGAARVDFTLITLASASAAHADGGFIEIDGTEMPGVYRCDVPDAAFAAGADFVIIYLRAASANNVITRPIRVDLATAGKGARTITFTVDDGSTALENATVRATNGSDTHTRPTDASGNCTFNLDDATYTIAITKAGYTYAGSSLVVSGDATPTLSMTAVSVTAPSDPSQATLSVWCRDENGADEQGAIVYAKMTAVPSGDTANAFDSKAIQATSDSDGLASLTVVRGATYSIKRGKGEWVTGAVIPDQATVTLSSILGVD